MSGFNAGSLLSGLRASVRRQSPFIQVDATGDSRSASRQFPLILGCQGIRFLLFGVTAYVLTRLIEPQEFGRLLMVSVPIALVNLLGDLGLGDGVVRSKEMDSSLASFFFWANLVIGTAAATVLVLCMPAFESWFGGVRLLDLGVAFAVVTILGSCVAQYRALLRRQLRLGSLSLGEVGVTLAGSVCSMTAAAAGLGATSVPLGRGVGLLVDLLLLVHMSGWIPGRSSSFSRARPVLAFGWRLALSGVFHFGGTAVANLLLGRVYGPESLGFVERATELSRGFVSRFDQVVRRVSYPLLARRAQVDPEGGRRMGARLVKAAILIWIVPACVLASLMPSLVSLLFGSEWRGLGEYLGWGWLGLALWLPLSMAMSMLLAYGHSGLLAYINISLFVVQMAVVLAGIRFGLDVYVCLLGLASLISGGVHLGLIGWRCRIDWASWLRSLLLFGGLGAGVAWLLVSVVGNACSSLEVVVLGCLVILVWFVILGWKSAELRSIGVVFMGAFRRAV